jgi:hypothetical protein
MCCDPFGGLLTISTASPVVLVNGYDVAATEEVE